MTQNIHINLLNVYKKTINRLSYKIIMTAKIAL